MRNLIRLLLTLVAALAALSLLDAERRAPVRGRSRGPDSGEDEEPEQCEAVTQSGVRCRRPAEPGSDYCWQHGG